MPGEVTAILAALCYSLSYVLLRKGQVTSAPRDNGLLPVLGISFITLALAITLQFTLDPTEFHNISSRAILYCIASGLIGTMMGRLALFTAIARVGATRGIVVKTLAPAFTLILATILLDEEIQSIDMVGMVVVFAGIALLLAEQHMRVLRGRMFAFFQQGMVVAVVAAVFQAIGHIFRKLGMDFELDPLRAATIDITTALIAYVSYLQGRRQLSVLVRAYVKDRNPYMITAGVTSAAAVLLFFTALSTVPVSHVSVILATEPLFVALFSTLFLQTVERLSWWTFGSAFLVAAGVIVMSLT